MNIANWLHATATSTPKAPALFSGTECVADYLTFAKRAAHLAQWMQDEFGLRAGDRVVLAMSNSTAYLEALYAVLWFGGAAVPVNVKLHDREILWIAGNAEASLVISDDGTLGETDALPAGGREIAVSRLAEVRENVPDGRLSLPAMVPSSALAWLFYTSGTTGRPKGVMLSHGNLVAMSLCYPIDVDQPSSADASFYAAPLSHGAGLYNFINVRVGARHVVPASQGFEPKEILDLGESLGNLTFFAAPTMVRRLVAEAKTTGRTGEGLRTIVYGGGPMYVADIEDALDAFGPKFVQIYGQGETPMTITALNRDTISRREGTRWRERLASVGVAHSCVDVRVVDEDLNDAGVDTPGEIVVRGPTVMQGYWRNEEATSSTIVDGWLHTGDIGYLDQDGYLTLTDRSKDVIISGGSNIYPREVEEVLLLHRGIAQAAVVGRPSREWGEDVVAFVVAKDGVALDTRSLDQWCRDQFASFKKPKYYEICADLPKNAYGKVLKTELRALLKVPEA